MQSFHFVGCSSAAEQAHNVSHVFLLNISRSKKERKENGLEQLQQSIDIHTHTHTHMVKWFHAPLFWIRQTE